MSKRFITKNIRLSLDFDRCVSRDPKVLTRIPSGAWIVFTVKGDPDFNKESRLLGRKIVARKRKKVIEARKEGSRWVVASLASV